MGGFAGAILMGVFAVTAIGGCRQTCRSKYGTQFGIQILDACVAVIYSFAVTFSLTCIINKVMGMRVTDEEEYVGLDIAQHGEQLAN